MDNEMLTKQTELQNEIDEYTPAIGDTFDKESYVLEKYAKCAMWCNANNAHIEDKGEYYECVGNPAPEPPTIEEIKQGLINQVQAHLDNACKERGYDNGFACASYATSSVPKFKAEAEAYILWRDKVWSYCYEQLALFEAGEREIPTDIIAELPELDW